MNDIIAMQQINMFWNEYVLKTWHPTDLIKFFNIFWMKIK